MFLSKPEAVLDCIVVRKSGELAILLRMLLIGYENFYALCELNLAIGLIMFREDSFSTPISLIALVSKLILFFGLGV